MKRKSFRYRTQAFPSLFVRPRTDHQPDRACLASANGQRTLRSKKIFVIKQVRRFRSTTGAVSKKRRILIFDNHPESLRLIFGRDAGRPIDFAEPPRASLWEFVLVAVLTFCAVFGMFWPLF